MAEFTRPKYRNPTLAAQFLIQAIGFSHRDVLAKFTTANVYRKMFWMMTFPKHVEENEASIKRAEVKFRFEPVKEHPVKKQGVLFFAQNINKLFSKGCFNSF